MLSITPERAKAIVQKKFPDYVLSDRCVQYKNAYIVVAHPDDGPEDKEHGFYPDPFYAVDRYTGRIRRIVPAMESDGGEAFYNALESARNG